MEFNAAVEAAKWQQAWDEKPYYPEGEVKGAISQVWSPDAAEEIIKLLVNPRKALVEKLKMAGWDNPNLALIAEDPTPEQMSRLTNSRRARGLVTFVHHYWSTMETIWLKLLRDAAREGDRKSADELIAKLRAVGCHESTVRMQAPVTWVQRIYHPAYFRYS